MKRIIAVAALLVCVLSANAQNNPIREYSNLWRFEEANRMLEQAPEPGRVVYMGDSITDNWARMRPGFFYSNGFIGRGISGQTTHQMLLRFRRDVIANKAAAVVILAGTNDIAHNLGPCSLQDIVDNIADMCDIAMANDVRPIICSVLPAHRYGWRKEMRPDIEIPKLNAMLRAYAAEQGITYLDFFSAMVDSDPENANGLPKKLANDGVHPTHAGYEIMESMVLAVLGDELAARKKAHGEDGLKLATYNIRNGKGMDGDVYGYRRTAEVISSLGADAVAIQELDCKTGRSGGKDVLGEIARMTGLHATYAKAIDYDGGGYGVGMLSMDEPVRTASVPLPGREEQRVLLMVELPGYIYCCTHLSLTEEDRLASVDIICDAVKEFAKGCRKPVFIAGDWNDEPGSKFMKKMQEHFDVLTDTAQCTFPSPEPEITIDYIARWNGSPARKLSKALGSKVQSVPAASDHRPVTIILK